jgi:predicted esterase
VTFSVQEAAGSGRFQPLRTAAFALLAAGDHAGALPYADAARDLFPGKGEVPFWLACIHSRLGETSAAVAALRAGLEQGHYWPRDWLLDDDDLESLRGRADFLEVVRESARAEAAAAAAPARLDPVVLPASSASGRPQAPRAVVLALHGWGQDADEFALHWDATAAAGFMVVVARSSLQPCPGFFVWDDRERALADVAAQLEAVWDHAAPLALAGFSQGGGVAVDLAVAGLPAPACCVLAISTGLDDVAWPPPPGSLSAAVSRGLRARLVAGDGDDALEDMRRLARVLAEAGLDGRLTVLPGMSHEVPEPPGEVPALELAALAG